MKLSIIGLCCLQLWLLQGCAGKRAIHQGNDLALRHISALEVATTCSDDDQFMDSKTLEVARSVLHNSLLKRLQKKKLITISEHEPQLKLCFEELYLRPSLVALVLFAVAEPDYVAVQASLVSDGETVETWHVKADNSAGGSMATPSEDRRLRMLVNVINRKVIKQLRQPQDATKSR